MKKILFLALVLFCAAPVQSQWAYSTPKIITGGTLNKIDSVRARYFFGFLIHRPAATNDTVYILQRGTYGVNYDTLFQSSAIVWQSTILTVPVKLDSTFLYFKSAQGSRGSLLYRE